MRELYPEIEPRDTFFVDVGDGHVIYAEESGNPAGKPVVVLHGGPGAGSSPRQRRFFDPDAYRIVLLDQRGSGQSTPHAAVAKNTTWDLVRDIERIRTRLGIDRWMVFGGSWGSTLAAGVRRAPSRGRHRAGAARDLPSPPLGAAVPLPGRCVAHLPGRVGGLRRADTDRRARRPHRRLSPSAVR